jgi:cytochrome P450
VLLTLILISLPFSLLYRSETTSNSTGFAIIELLRHPEKMKKLRTEIDMIPLENNKTLHTHEQLKHLPYLNAVINEAMRLNPISGNGLPRITRSDITLGGKIHIPKDVSTQKKQKKKQQKPGILTSFCFHI